MLEQINVVPVEADTLDGKNAAEIGNDLTFVELFMNDAAAFHERVDLEQSLNAWNFDDGFIDILWDQSKISSTSNITVTEGQNNGGDGKLELAYNLGETESVDVNAGTDDFPNTHSFDVSVHERGVISAVAVRNGSSNSGDFTVEIRDSSSNVLASKTANLAGSGGTKVFSFTYSDYSRALDGETATIRVTTTDGSIRVANGQSYSGQKFSYSSESVLTDTYGDFSKTLEFANLQKTGTVTTIRKELDFTPSKIVANPDYILNGQSLELVISDNSGNSVTLQPSDFETEISVNFQDGNLQGKWQFSGDGSSSPEVQKTKFLGVA